MLFVQSLSDLLDNKTIGEEKIKQIFASFITAKDKDISDFLKNLAIDYEKNDIARTFLICDDKYPATVLAYFTIGLNVMKLELDKTVDDAYKGVNLFENDFHPIYKLFMIGKDDNSPVKFSLQKTVFEKEVMGRIYESKKIVGTDLMYLDCIPELLSYYQGLKFQIISKDEENNLFSMIRRI